MQDEENATRESSAVDSTRTGIPTVTLISHALVQEMDAVEKKLELATTHSHGKGVET